MRNALFLGSALCSNQPCRNGGICSDVQDFIVCNCKEGFTGPFCESTSTSIAIHFTLHKVGFFENNKLFHNPCIVASCNVTLLAPQGTITSPNYPGDYNSIENCLWTIIAPAGYLIYLRFDAFAIEPSNSINECVDFVRVYNDSGTFSRFPDEKYENYNHRQRNNPNYVPSFVIVPIVVSIHLAHFIQQPILCISSC